MWIRCVEESLLHGGKTMIGEVSLDRDALRECGRGGIIVRL